VEDDERTVGGDRVELGAGDIAFFGERFVVELPDRGPASGLGRRAGQIVADRCRDAGDVGNRRSGAQIESAGGQRGDGEMRMGVDEWRALSLPRAARRRR
jgi:hypothetical protein